MSFDNGTQTHPATDRGGVHVPLAVAGSILSSTARIPGLSAVALGAAAAGGAALYSRFIEPHWLDVTWQEAVLPGLSRPLDGIVMAHLTDLHVRETITSRDAVARAIQACNGVQPDLAVITGDLASRREAIAPLKELLRRLDTRPVYVVFGNHEYRFGPSHRLELAEALSDLGLTILNNCATTYERHGRKLWIAGVDDGYTSHDRLDLALAGLGETDHPRILLSHYPDLAARPIVQSVDLVLAGHSHGGQVNLPILIKHSLARADTAYAGGRFTIGRTTLYVSRGLGTSGYPVRLFARPELAFFILRTPRLTVDAGVGDNRLNGESHANRPHP